MYDVYSLFNFAMTVSLQLSICLSLARELRFVYRSVDRCEAQGLEENLGFVPPSSDSIQDMGCPRYMGRVLGHQECEGSDN